MREHLIQAIAERRASPQTLPLTWAQANMWESILAFGEHSQGSNVWLPLTLAPPYPRVEQAVGRLGEFCAAAEITRTTFDTSLAVQRVRPSLELPVHIADAAGDPESSSIALLRE